MPTLQEIIDFPPIAKGCKYTIAEAMNSVARDSCNDNYYYDEYKGTSITCDIVADIDYDQRRGAQTVVLRFNSVPFAVISRAGRELSDVTDVYVVDAEFAARAVLDAQPQPEFDPFNKDHDITMAYWEGTPVELGESGFKEPT